MAKSFKETITELFSKNADLLKKNGIKLSAEPVKFASATTEDGKTIYTDAEAWAAGVACYSDEQGTVCPDGSYKLNTGETVVVKEGKVSEITPAEEDMTAEQVNEVMASLIAKLDENDKSIAALTAELADIKTKFQTADKKATDLTAENTRLKAAAQPSSKKSEEKKQPEPVQFGKVKTAEGIILEGIREMKLQKIA